jgi:hypothetical protein
VLNLPWRRICADYGGEIIGIDTLRSDRVDLEKMLPYIEELTLRAGGIRPAARLLDVSHQSIMRWLRRSEWHNRNQTVDSMTKESAALIITTLQAIRRKDRDSKYVERINQTIREQAAREERFLRRIGCG